MGRRTVGRDFRRATPLFLGVGNCSGGLPSRVAQVCQRRRLGPGSFGGVSDGLARSIPGLGTRGGTNPKARSQRGASPRYRYHCMGWVDLEYTPTGPSSSARPPSTLCPGTIGGITSRLCSPGAKNNSFGTAAVTSSRSGFSKMDDGGGTAGRMKSNLAECFRPRTVETRESAGLPADLIIPQKRCLTWQGYG